LGGRRWFEGPGCFVGKSAEEAEKREAEGLSGAGCPAIRVMGLEYGLLTK
jgi:hypothetical protein